MRNKDVADLFYRMGTLLEIQGENPFKARAYSRAADNISGHGEDIQVLLESGRLGDIPGLGKALQEKIAEYLTSGKVAAYENLTEQVPETILDIVAIPSIGPKKAKLFFDRLGIAEVEALEKAAEAGTLAGLPGIKDRTVQHILEGIRIVRQGRERMTLDKAARLAEEIVSGLVKIPGVKRAEAAGSLRRRKETVRDIDILVDSSCPLKVMEAFMRLPQVRQVQSRGETKASVLTADNVQVDLRVVETCSYGAALLYFTGSKNFNVALRQVAMKKGMKVNEYGIFRAEGDTETRLAGKTEQECFRALGLPFVPPELREDIGEERLFRHGEPRPECRIPRLIKDQDIRGDLHVHSDWSDGQVTVEDLARAAVSRGYEYLGVSDHSVSLRVARGLSLDQLKKKKARIDRVNKTYRNFRLLFGTEVEIDGEGGLDYDDRVLAGFDVVVAAIHTGLEQSRDKITQRLIRACHNPRVNIIAHPTGVHAGKREAYDLDLKAVCRAAAETGTALEINAFPVRLDLNAVNTYFAREQGARFAVNTDAHRLEHLDFMRWGVAVARRGWLVKADVINTLPLKELLKVLKK